MGREPSCSLGLGGIHLLLCAPVFLKSSGWSDVSREIFKNLIPVKKWALKIHMVQKSVQNAVYLSKSSPDSKYSDDIQRNYYQTLAYPS